MRKGIEIIVWLVIASLLVYSYSLEKRCRLYRERCRCYERLIDRVAADKPKYFLDTLERMDEYETIWRGYENIIINE